MTISNWVRKVFIGGADIPSPSGILPRDAVTKDGLRVTIDFERVLIPFTMSPRIEITAVANTNSIDAVIDGNPDARHVGILIHPADTANRRIMAKWLSDQPKADSGNVITAYYTIGGVIKRIIHRINKIGWDSLGRYFILKGDNNAFTDPYKVRDDNVDALLGVIVYTK